MQSKRSGIVALGVSGVMLAGAIAFAMAAPAKKPAKKPAAGGTALVAAGKKVYDTCSPKCSMCHAIGTKDKKVGPELTHIGKTWSDAKLTTVIRTPKKLKADGKMPAYGPDKINDKDLKALVAYLKSLK